MPRTVYDRKQKAEVLQRLHECVLIGLEAGELEVVSRCSNIVFYEAGAIILKDGVSDGRIFCLISGRVEAKAGDRTVSVFQEPGDIFGDFGLVDKTKLRTSAIASRDKTLCLAINTHLVRSLESSAHRHIMDRIIALVLADQVRKAVDRFAWIRDQLVKTEQDLKEEQDPSLHESIKRHNDTYKKLFESFERLIFETHKGVLG